MTTLIAVYSSDGCEGRCDAKCYDAAEDTCTCICQGVNHKAGRLRAEANVQALAESWLESWHATHGPAARVEINAQPALPFAEFATSEHRTRAKRKRAPGA